MCRSGPCSEQQEGQHLRLVVMWMCVCIGVHTCMPYFSFPLVRGSLLAHMFEVRDFVTYTRSTGAQPFATIMGRSPYGDQFRHIQYVQSAGARAVEHPYAPVLSMVLARVWAPPPCESSPSSPAYPEASNSDARQAEPPQPQASNLEARRGEPPQPNRPVRRKVQVGIDKFFSQHPEPPNLARSPAYAADAVAVTCTKRRPKRWLKVLVQHKPLHDFCCPSDKIRALDYAERHGDQPAARDLGIKDPKSLVL